jgi:hypothetical protein
VKKAWYIGVISSSFLLSACATLLNPNTKEVDVYTTKPSKIIFGNDTIHTQNNKAYLVVERSNQSVTFRVLNIDSPDDSVKTITLKPRNSIAFYANIPYTYGLGLIADWRNPKRYTYASRVFLNSDDKSSHLYRYDQRKRKNALYLHLSLPHANLFYFKPQGYGEQFSTGFLGIAVGLDYYHQENQYINATLNTVIDFLAPIPVPIENFDGREIMNSTFLTASNNHLVKHFTFGYGLSFARNSWGYYPGVWENEEENIVRKHYAAGLVFTTYIKTGPHFNIGILYRPTFIRFNTPDPLAYEHYFGLDLAWKIRLIN